MVRPWIVGATSAVLYFVPSASLCCFRLTELAEPVEMPCYRWYTRVQTGRKRHVVITEHLDLRALPPIPELEADSAIAGPFASTASIRVRPPLPTLISTAHYVCLHSMGLTACTSMPGHSGQVPIQSAACPESTAVCTPA